MWWLQNIDQAHWGFRGCLACSCGAVTDASLQGVSCRPGVSQLCSRLRVLCEKRHKLSRLWGTSSPPQAAVCRGVSSGARGGGQAVPTLPLSLSRVQPTRTVHRYWKTIRTWLILLPQLIQHIHTVMFLYFTLELFLVFLHTLWFWMDCGRKPQYRTWTKPHRHRKMPFCCVSIVLTHTLSFPSPPTIRYTACNLH